MSVDEFELVEWEDRLEQERSKNARLVANNKRLLREVDTQRERIELLTAVDGLTGRAPKDWARPKPKGKRHVGLANLLLSDLHLDETVDPAQMGGVNAYNRRIAERRLRATFDKFLLVARDYIAGIDYEGAVVPLLGDIFSGNIHEELRQTNESSILDSIDHWIDPFVSGLRMVADDMGRVHVPCIVGNHGRNTYKPIHKGSVRDNFDWLFYRQLARALAGDDRVTFDIPDATWTQMSQYGTSFHFEHGDRGFRGGHGIAGIFSPIRHNDLKLRRRQAATNQPYDVLVLGHFHHYLPVPAEGFIVNGSLKGYDEYAQDNKFGFEPPSQAFYVVTPENGCTFSAPILPMDRKEEGW